MKATYQLCSGRHPVPGNPPAIFPGTVNPLAVEALAETVRTTIPEDVTTIDLHVTGLSVALLAVVAVCAERGIILYALHYDRDSGTYYRQRVL